jgi:hypothetical protein
MPVINIQTLAKPTALTTQTDTGNPYSYAQWIQYHNNIDTRSAVDQYNAYLKQWYKDRANTPNGMVMYVKNLYIQFLKQLGLTARNAEEQQFFSTVDFNNDLDTQSAIRYYARKLKDVSRYLAERRNTIQYAKLKYNLLGTNGYLEGLFYSYILSVFTTRPDNTGTTGLVISNGDLVQYLPSLSDIKDVFSVEIEELYDTANYLDRDPSVDISQYTTFNSGTSAQLYETSFYEVPSEYLLGLIIQALNSANSLSPCYGVSGFVGTSISNTNMAANNVYTYTGDGSSTTFALSNITNTDATLYRVTIDGLVQTPFAAYSISVPNKSITFTGIPPVGSEIVILAPTT